MKTSDGDDVEQTAATSSAGDSSTPSRSLLKGKDGGDADVKPTLSDVVIKLENNILQAAAAASAAGQSPGVRSSARLRQKLKGSGSAPGGVTSERSGEESEGAVQTGSVVNEDTESDVDIMDCSEDVKAQVMNTAAGDVRSSPSMVSSLAVTSDTVELEHVQHSDLKFRISMHNDLGKITPRTLPTTDVTKPLSIQTKFASAAVSSAGPGTGSSTDTASEMGSALSSPVCSTGQPSPNVLARPGGGAAAAAHRSLGDMAVGEMAALRCGLSELSTQAGGVMTSGSEAGSPDAPRVKRKRAARRSGFTPKVCVRRVAKQMFTCT